MTYGPVTGSAGASPLGESHLRGEVKEVGQARIGAKRQPTVVSIGNTARRDVALTFDAGADLGYAPMILQILERNHIKATFGMTGLWARANPSLVRRMVKDGDTLMNHTYDHRSFTGLSTRGLPLSRAQRIWEIDQAESVVRRVAHKTTRPYFRPPFGDYDSATLRLVGQLGYRYVVMWSLDSLGWQHLAAASILRRCLTGLRPGAIYLMHVGIQSQDALALQPLIRHLKLDHYGFQTIPQLVAGRGR